MLYDPRWEVKVEPKIDPLSMGNLIAWLKTKPEYKAYCYMDSGNCLLAQYAKECLGISDPIVGAMAIHHAGGKIKYGDDMIAVVAHWPRTYGGALERAQKHLNAN